MFADDEADLAKVIAENERLRKLLHDLDEQLAAAGIDAKICRASDNRLPPDDGVDEQVRDASKRGDRW